jgi:hypothetical protein
MPFLRPNESVTLSIIGGDKLALFSRAYQGHSVGNRLSEPAGDQERAQQRLRCLYQRGFLGGGFGAHSGAKVGLVNYATGTAPTIPERPTWKPIRRSGNAQRDGHADGCADPGPSS